MGTLLVKGNDGRTYKRLQPEEAVSVCLDIPLYVRWVRVRTKNNATNVFDPWFITPEKGRISPGTTKERVSRWKDNSGLIYDGYFYVRVEDTKPEYVSESDS